MAAGLVELTRWPAVRDAPVAFHEQSILAMAAGLVELARWSAGRQATSPISRWRCGGGDRGSDCCGASAGNSAATSVAW